LAAVQDEGARQLEAYLDRAGLEEGWLLIFDQRPGLTWDECLWRNERDIAGKRLHLRGA